MLGIGSLKGLDERVWILCVGRVISATGFSIVMPFLAIYLVLDLSIPMGLVGLLFLGMAVAGALGQMVGGELADRLGRRPVMFASMGLRGLNFILIFLTLVVLGDLWLIASLLLASSLLGSLFEPASNAMVADIVGPGRRMEAYSLLRVGQNIGWTLGPLISGIMILFLPFSSLFLVAASTSIAVAVVIFLKVADPSRSAGPRDKFHPRDLMKLWHNKLFLIFCLASLPLAIVLGQMSSTFSVFSVADVGIAEAEMGYLYALNGLLVVALQFPMARYISHFRMSRVLAAGAMMYAVGYLIVGFADGIWLLVLSMIVTTLGENTVSPSSMNLVAQMSPENERGRYMGAYGIFSSFGWSLGPAVGGLMYEGLHADPLALWGGIALIALVSTIGFIYLGKATVLSRDSVAEVIGAKG
jgi:MFS family permease